MSEPTQSISPIPGLVSVIMPAYNAERFIAEAIESVLAQSYPHWELIVVDDGSTDGTLQVLAKYTDPRIKVISQVNGGEGAARNTGLDKAVGQYVAFLDADDLYLPNGLADMVGYLESHSHCDVVYSDGVLCDLEKRPLMHLSELRPGTYEGQILEHLVVSNIVISVVSTAVNRSAIEVQALRFNTMLNYGVDWDFWTRLALTSQFGYTPVLTCLYRVHGFNMTSAVTFRRRKAELVVGRLMVMNAEWFPNLSVGVRRQFFYNLLLGLLDEEPGQQQAIMQAPPYQALPRPVQAKLLRLVASSHLTQWQNTEFARKCLRQSLALQPENHKTRWLLGLLDRSPSLAVATISVWRVAHTASNRLRAIGRRKPKPVPAMLLPKS